MNSNTKGRNDYFETFRRMGMKQILIPTVRKKQDLSLVERSRFENKLRKTWERKLEFLGCGDLLVIHSPNSEKYSSFADTIERVRSRGCKVLVVAFELETFFYADYKRAAKLKRHIAVSTERRLFEISDAVVVHNGRMKAMLEGIGVDGSKMFSVGVMDYLRDDVLSNEPNERIRADRPVAFAGNLSAEKSTFEYMLPEGFRCNLYGADYTGPVNDDVQYKGVFDPIALMDEMEGSFGLVWDGDSVDACTGSYGHYLTFNNPHKIAVYLASGMPVIVWDRIAMADFVRKENCGLTVGSLREVPGRIASLSEKEYEEMRLNACRVGNEMRRGVHIRAAVEKALDYAKLEEEKHLTRSDRPEIKRKLKESKDAYNKKRAKGPLRHRGMPGQAACVSPDAGIAAYGDVERGSGRRCSGNRSYADEKRVSPAEGDPVIESDARRNALIIFTREPAPGKTKTRLMPRYTPEQCAEIHECFLRDIAAQIRGVDADVFVAYTGGEPAALRRIFADAFKGKRAFEQKGDGLGARMENAFAGVLGKYDKAVLIGTDIPELRAETINDAFGKLGESDVVLGPTADGGYYLIGMREVRHEAFDVKLYGTGTVYEETAASIRAAGLRVSETDTYSDIDVPEDVSGLRKRLRERRWDSMGLHRGRNELCPATEAFLNDTACISVIVPVYNESETIDALLGQLLPYRDEAEIIIVDGGSTDDTCVRIETALRRTGAEEHVKLLHSRKGRGVQMNAGAEESSGDILFFLHCDSVLPADFIEQIRSCMRKGPYGCFGVSFPSHNFFMFTNRVISNHRAKIRGIPFGDQGLFIDRSLFFEAGGFPEIPVMEDYEFSLRMKRKGFAPVMAPGRIVSSARRYGRGTASVLRTELKMWWIRRLYRMGAAPERLAEKYRDVR